MGVTSSSFRGWRVATLIALLILFPPEHGIPFACSQESPVEPAGEHSVDEWAGKPVMGPEHVSAMVSARLRNAPKLGERAPEFSLADAFTGAVVKLGDLWTEKPVVLFFASYSCLTAQESTPDMAGIASRFGNIADFVLVYIREAHPTNGFLPPYRGDPFVIPAPSTFADRASAAVRFARERELRFRVLIDRMDDSTAVRWGAWPLRVFVVGQSGRVLYAGQQGPWYFRPTAKFDPRLEGTPKSFGDLPGYSKESLEEFLIEMEKRSARP